MSVELKGIRKAAAQIAAHLRGRGLGRSADLVEAMANVTEPAIAYADARTEDEREDAQEAIRKAVARYSRQPERVQ